MATVKDIRDLIEGMPDDAEVDGLEQQGGSVSVWVGERELDLTFGWVSR